MTLASGVTVALPAASNAAVASAAACSTHLPVYLIEGKPGSVDRPVNPPPKVIRKYIDWSPYNGDTEGHLLDTDITAQLPGTSTVFGGEDGVIYEITQDGTLKSYKDNTETGGALLSPLSTYGSGWKGYSKVWTTGGSIFALSATDGSISGFSARKGLDNKPYMKPLAVKIPATDPAAVAIASATHVWGTADKMFTLSGGEVREWDYSLEYVGVDALAPKLADNGVIATGLTSATSAWTPAPGVLYAKAGSQDYTGVVKSYTGSPLTLANSEVRVGFYGTVLPDTADCLTAPSPDEKPNFGNQPAPPPIDLPQPDPEPAPADGPVTVSGKFTLGNGSPAAGMTVRITPNDPALVGEVGTSKEITPLGTVVTAADGTWSFTLPDELPSEVQAQADANGGVLNVGASVFGTTSSGVQMFAVDQVVAAPASTSATTQSSPLAMTDAAEPSHTVAMLPAAAPDADTSAPTAAQERTSYAAQYERLPIASPDDAALTPAWQNDRGAPPDATYNPYLVNGVDVRAQTVTDESRTAPRDSGSCYTLTKNIASQIAYTTVGEAHAYWDAKASFEYKTKMTTTVDTAIKGTGSWSVTRGITLGGSAGASTGFTNRGPYFGKHWRIPVNYVKQQVTYYCGGIARSSYQRIAASGYKVPPGGYTGQYGKDVSHLDGMARFYKSPYANRARIAPNSGFGITKGRSAKISGAASVMGISLAASTQMDKDHEQKIFAGSSRASDHWIWGLYAQVATGKEGTFYSY
ncbi:hypothetical protein ACFU3J_00355 [Streptomyces sp. NPDC057411]|uniref:hypothetical protein n=1 Tax=unclassified Streptomyces TaxID=2593676 RepID=UPI003626913F